MNVFVISAGLVGATVVEALHADHAVTVVDMDPTRLKTLASRFDVATATANAVSRAELLRAGLAEAELVIACTLSDEANLVAGAFAKGANPTAATIIRTSRAEYVDLWRDGHISADFVVSSEVETALAVSSAIGMPSARHTASFADGQVQIAEIDVAESASWDVIGRPLRDAVTPEGSRVACVLRDDRPILPKGDVEVQVGDRLIVVGTPDSAHRWCDLVSPRRGDVRDVVVFGAEGLGASIADRLHREGLDVRVVEAEPGRASELAEQLPGVRVFGCTGLDPLFLQREGISRAQAAVFAMRDDARNLFAATLARVHGVPYTIALAHEPVAEDVYELGGIDVTVEPGRVTADAILRFAHDPRTQQLSTLEHDRFVILDITTRPESEYVGLALGEMPLRDALIGAVVRDGTAFFPRSQDRLRAGDRVIVFCEAVNAPMVERVL